MLMLVQKICKVYQATVMTSCSPHTCSCHLFIILSFNVGVATIAAVSGVSALCIFSIVVNIWFAIWFIRTKVCFILCSKCTWVCIVVNTCSMQCNYWGTVYDCKHNAQYAAQ